MDFLKLLEGIRTPLLDKFFSYLTYLGDETLFLVIGLIFFWCVSKQVGRYLINVGLLGSVVSQWLKLAYRIPRPWVLDENFTIVESARAGAAGYSFPSGHTQVAVGVYGGFARWVRNKAARIIAIVIAVLVPFSRMYLGVHTPLDVGVAAAVALLMLFALYPPMAGRKAGTMSVRISLLVTIAAAVAYTVYVCAAKFPADTDAANLESGVKNAWTLLGASIGIWASFEIDERWVHFETKASLPGQLLKVVIGLALVMGLRMGLKPLLSLVFGSHPAADAVRYLLMVLFAGAVWPMSFQKLAKIGQKA